MFRSYIPQPIKYNWIFGIVCILLFTALRFYLVLDANVSRNYGSASFIFVAMAILPFILLNKEGRRYIGIKKPKNYQWLLAAFALGIIACSITYLIFTILYDHSISNSMVYISQSYAVDNLNTDNKFIFFSIFALTGMTFSPIGEELFYRGLIHGSFVSKFGEKNASTFDSLAFAIAHLSHFGIIYHIGKWDFLPLPAIFWMASMYFLSKIFFLCKQQSGSILGAIISHAGFNLAMMYWIFYHIL